MNIQTIVVVLLIIAAFFLIARKGCGCSGKATKSGDKKDEGNHKDGCCGHSH